MAVPVQSYIISCTPRSGSHLLADMLQSTNIAGCPDERFPRYPAGTRLTAADRDALVTQGMPDSSFDAKLDSEHVALVLERGTTANGVFALNLHWFQLNDAVRRIGLYLQTNDNSPHKILSSAFPGLSYIWLRRRDKVAQAVSWYKAILTGQYVKLHGDEKPRSENLQFDFHKIKEYWTALRSFDNGWDYYFKSNNLQPLVLYYEDVAADPGAAAKIVLDYLKLESGGIVFPPPRHAKAADRISDEWIKTFKDMQAANRGGAERSRTVGARQQ